MFRLKMTFTAIVRPVGMVGFVNMILTSANLILAKMKVDARTRLEVMLVYVKKALKGATARPTLMTARRTLVRMVARVLTC